MMTRIRLIDIETIFVLVAPRLVACCVIYRMSYYIGILQKKFCLFNFDRWYSKF